MNIPIELVGVFMTAIIGLQAWIVREIIAIKVKMAAKGERIEELEKRVDKLETAKAIN